MQGIMEAIFDVCYLSSVIYMGIKMIAKSKNDKQHYLFGIMAVVLGCGDAFHLIPRAYGLLTTGLEANATALGIGKAITSVTMTIFYVLLYNIWRLRYKTKENKILMYSVYGLAILRVILCMFPQNEWLNYYQPLNWSIYRNIPFALLGLIIIFIFYKEAKKNNDMNFKNMWLAVVLSFAFYIPVVLFSNSFPIIGILMIPKTMAYVWIVYMGYSEIKDL